MIEKPIEYKGYFIFAQYLIDSDVPCGYALGILNGEIIFITDIVRKTVEQMQRLIDILTDKDAINP